MPHAVPRLAPELPFPSYAYVRGQQPHPTRDAAGHSFGKPAQSWTRPDPDQWEACRPYLYGIDLFNHGYYWEAHEVWEGLWHACGRQGMVADFLKGLIALAAVGVKLREGSDRGVRQHAARAVALFNEVVRELGPTRTRFLGLEPEVLAQFAAAVADGCMKPTSSKGAILPFLLPPQHHPSAL